MGYFLCPTNLGLQRLRNHFSLTHRSSNQSKKRKEFTLLVLDMNYKYTTIVRSLILGVWLLAQEASARLKWSSQSSSCIRNRDCPSRSFCKLPDGDCVRKHKRNWKGHCEELNFFCTRIYWPVCGCNDRTYSNACTCHSKGVNIASEGQC